MGRQSVSLTSAATPGLFVGAALAAALCAWVAGARAAEPPAPSLFVDCRGEATASPTVILEAGAFGTSADWDYILADLAKGGRACAYDRAGLGRSPAGPGGVDVLARARQIGDLLAQIGERRPVILVGHSNGALYIEAFAKLFPERVAGLVYVNGVGEDDLGDPALIRDLTTERRLSRLAVTGARLGLAPLLADQMTGDEGLTGEAIERKQQALTCHPCLAVARDEDIAIVPGLAATAALDGEAVRHIPTVVIVGAPFPKNPLAKAWRAAEIKPAARADHAWILDAPGASHVSPLARDRAYVDAAVNWLRAAGRP